MLTVIKFNNKYYRCLLNYSGEVVYKDQITEDEYIKLLTQI